MKKEQYIQRTWKGKAGDILEELEESWCDYSTENREEAEGHVWRKRMLT